jgi:phosphoadenosine phosphosulfate reductase
MPGLVEQTQTQWTRERLKAVSESLEGQSPEAILRWGLEHFAPGIALATGFGPEGIVLMHLVSQTAPETTVFYLDTDLLFQETYELRDELEARLGIKFTRVNCGFSVQEQEDNYGPRLWSYEPNACCQLRKVEPLRQFLATQQAWMTAIRRDQTAHRANAGLVEWDKTNGLVKLNPLAAWTSDQVWNYIYENDLPYNKLHNLGYPSIGCWPCTRAVVAGQDPRSGRWSDSSKTECGIHLQAKAQP